MRYVERYERADLSTTARPPEELTRRIRAASTVFASPSPRAVQSLQLLDPGRAPRLAAVFSEEPQVVPLLSGRWPLLVWFAASRGLGAFDPGAAGTRCAMRARADRAAETLIAAAAEGPTALVGHGWFNRAIAAALARKDWRRVDAIGGTGSLGRVSATWGYALFAPPDRAPPP